MYISLWENSRGHPDNVSFMQFSTKINGFEQKDSRGFENSYNSYEQYPLEKFFIFTIYQNYTLALKMNCTITFVTWILYCAYYEMYHVLCFGFSFSLQEYDRLLITTWGHDPGLVSTSNALLTINDALAHSAVLIQVRLQGLYSVSQEKFSSRIHTLFENLILSCSWHNVVSAWECALV